jgi:hypothetical protein
MKIFLSSCATILLHTLIAFFLFGTLFLLILHGLSWTFAVMMPEALSILIVLEVLYCLSFLSGYIFLRGKKYPVKKRLIIFVYVLTFLYLFSLFIIYKRIDNSGVLILQVSGIMILTVGVYSSFKDIETRSQV